MSRKALTAAEADIARSVEDIEADAKARTALPIDLPDSIHEDPEPWQRIVQEDWAFLLVCIVVLVAVFAFGLLAGLIVARAMP